jgi:transcriptional regulator with XRE-family HTH domain
MDQMVIGKFIAKCRKEKKLTQAQLAERLDITDRAVSKWETGKSMPDSSIMLELCEILGITVNELLSGEKVDEKSFEKKADENLIAMTRKVEKGQVGNVAVSIIFSTTLLLGIVVCLICNVAISGVPTWSLIPICSIIFAWLVLFPGVALGRKGIFWSLLSLSVFLIPYLYVLSRLIKVERVVSIGAVMAMISILFLWLVFGIFKVWGKTRKWAALGSTFLALVPFQIIINVALSKMIGEPVFDIWDMLLVFTLLILAIFSYNRGILKGR